MDSIVETAIVTNEDIISEIFEVSDNEINDFFLPKVTDNDRVIGQVKTEQMKRMIVYLQNVKDIILSICPKYDFRLSFHKNQVNGVISDTTYVIVICVHLDKLMVTEELIMENIKNHLDENYLSMKDFKFMIKEDWKIVFLN